MTPVPQITATRCETIPYVTRTNHTSWTTATCVGDRTGTVQLSTRNFSVTTTTLPFHPMILSGDHHDLQETTTVRGSKGHTKKTPSVDGMPTPTTNDKPLSTTRGTIDARTITIPRTVQHSTKTIPT